MAWTEQQQNAIEAGGTSVIVSAAAGSGKTAVLTERIIRLIADPKSGVRADRMVVVTFTTDAASELKKRLERKLRDLINENPLDSHLVKQQVLLQNAKISTINSFCFELVRDNIDGQGITSGFKVLDETDDKVIGAQAMEDLINFYSENEYEKISYIYDKFCLKNIKRLMNVISGLAEFLSSVALSDRWLEKAVAEYRKDFKESLYYNAFLADCIANLTEAERLAEEYVSMIDDVFLGDTSCQKYEETYAQAVGEHKKIKWFADIFRSGRIPDGAENAKADNFERLVAKSKKIEYDEDKREISQKKRKKYIEIVRSMIFSEDVLESDFIESGRVTEILAEMIRKYQEIVWEKKCAKNAISFDDGERLALEILAGTDENGNVIQSETALKIADFYDIIMIDEYQDSNNKQDMIFKLMSKNCHNDGKGLIYGDNAFLVGDLKQAIYRFRLANPRNFINTLKSAEPYGTGGSSNKKIFLNKNFRSSAQVLDFSNYVFGNIMSEKCGDVAYSADEILNFGAESYRNAKISPTHISFVNVGNDKEKGRKPKNAKSAKPNPEAVFTARKIAEMLESGVEVILENGRSRRCVPSDFCILLRGNKHINEYADELEKLGIRAERNEESGYLRSREIALLIDLLRIINNPLADVPMTAVMTSPMYMFGISETAYIKALDAEKPLFSVILGIVNGEYPYCDSGLVGRCADFLKSLERFRLDSVTMTIGELINSIYDTTDFISVMQLYSDGDRKRANLRALIQYAKGYEQSVAYEGTGGLGGFLRHIDRILENKGDYIQGKISSSSGDYVSVMTIHRSKGLEFTFVFMAENMSDFRFDSDSVMCSDDGMIGYILYDRRTLCRYKTFQQTMLANIEKKDTKSEEMRLLYVGFTRAKQQLFVNLKYNDGYIENFENLVRQYVSADGNIENMVCNSSRFCDWIWLCLIKHADFSEIADYFDIALDYDFPDPVSDKKLFKCEFCAEVSEKASAEEKTFIKADPDKNLCERMKSIIYSDYDNTLSEIPAKLSVTQILRKFREDKNFDFQLRRPEFMSATKKLTGAERGTAIHTFFQYCNFENAIKNPSGEICRIADMGYISKAQAESIDIARISAFFRSDLYKRIASAENVWRERKFTVAVADLNISGDIMEKFRKSDGMIKGIIDLMFEEEDGLVLVDYKSDRGVSGAYLEERYRIQIQIYRSAIELTLGRPVKEAYLYSVELKKSIPVKI